LFPYTTLFRSEICIGGRNVLVLPVQREACAEVMLLGQALFNRLLRTSHVIIDRVREVRSKRSIGVPRCRDWHLVLLQHQIDQEKDGRHEKDEGADKDG